MDNKTKEIVDPLIDLSDPNKATKQEKAIDKAIDLATAGREDISIVEMIQESLKKE